MDLWIRTQNKEQLIKVDNIFIDYVDDVQNVGKTIYLIMNNSIVLGYFDIKDNAIKVINEIHEKLINLQTLYLYPDAYRTVLKRKNLDCVYQIPEE